MGNNGFLIGEFNLSVKTFNRRAFNERDFLIAKTLNRRDS